MHIFLTVQFFLLCQSKIDRIQGANVEGLESKIQQHIGSGEEDSGEDFGQGLVCGYIKCMCTNACLSIFPILIYIFLQMDLNVFITKNQCECLNESDEHTLEHALTSGGGYLQSDCDEQLILSIAFNQAVKIHSLKFKAPEKLGPKNLKIFINQPRTIDFDQAESCTSVQDLA